MISKNSKIYIAGHKGMVGSAIWRNLTANGFTNLVGKTSSELDLKDQKSVLFFFHDEKPEIVDLPKSVANISLFHRTLLLRAMRPDRLTYALKEFVSLNMGIEYTE
jgi:nucleoside-diphosphate-sugar epimerase